MGPNESHFLAVLFAVFILCVFDGWLPIAEIDLFSFLSKLGIPFFS